MPPPDASGSSKANKSFPAGRSCRVILALCPPTASTFPSPRSAETSAAQSPVLRALAERRQSPAQSPDFCACSAQRPAFAAAAHPQRPRIFAPFSAAPYRPHRRTLRLIPRRAASPAFAFPRSPATSPFSRSRPPLRIASQAFFLYIPSQGKSSLSIFS